MFFCRASAVSQRERMSESQAKPKVLVADDERAIADTLSIILNQAGFEATAVYSGEKAVETAKTLKPDMLISDVIMTDMNGIDAAITIRGMLPNCKILLFSGQAATADLLDRAAGTDMSLIFSPNPFIRKISSPACEADLTIFYLGWEGALFLCAQQLGCWGVSPGTV